jgi:serine phosphatase RsbU (regulator of sigma subunit)
MTRHMTVPDDTASLEPSPPDAITRDREILKVGAPSSTWRLLVVDDADNDYLVVRELLAQGLPGATINRAIAVSDACLTAAAADCVLLDVGVPDADGTVGVKRLTEEAPDTAIVVLTAAANEDLGVASLSAGAQDYLVKSRLDEQLLARSVRYAIERHRAAQLSRELIRADRQRAENARLERALTPTPIIRSSDITVVVRYQAGRRGSRLGGDFYDAVEGDDGRCAVLVGDVAGHGPDAAALAARLRSAWRALTLARLDQVAIVGVLDRFLRTEVEELTFATLSVLVVGQDRSDGTLVLAGHPPPVRLGSPSRTVGAGAHGPLVGVMPQPHWSSVEVGLGPGAELLLYTDGLVEGRAEGDRRERLGVDMLVELLDDLRTRGLAASGLLDALLDEVQRRNGVPLSDDVVLCLVGIPDA